MGEYEHARMQAMLILFFAKHEKRLGFRVVPEQRVQVGATRFRIPDVCLISIPPKPASIVSTPPLLCIEVLSPEDTLHSIQERIDDYLAFGVPCVWVVNPISRRGWMYTTDSIREAKDGVMRTPNLDIEVPLVALFDAD